MTPRQLSLLPRCNTVFDAEKRRGRRKSERPFHPKLALHVTMRAAKARGSSSLLHQSHKYRVTDLLYRSARNHRVRVYRFANVGTHIHLLLQARDRKGLRAFLRQFAGGVAQVVTGSVKGRPQKFWDSTAWSKMINWGRHFKAA